VLGIKVVVDKKRILYYYKNARIHVDTVKDLGNFMEIEVEVKKGDKQAETLMKELLEYLQIPKSDFIKNSYSDLLLKKK
jgi:predicted adenylyl cyclase CyaB